MSDLSGHAALHDRIGRLERRLERRRARLLADAGESLEAASESATRLLPIIAAAGAGLAALWLIRRRSPTRTFSAFRGSSLHPRGGRFDGPSSRESSARPSGSAPVPRPAASGTTSGRAGAAGTEPAVSRAGWWKGAAKSITGWWSEEHVASKAAALSFYTAFSLAPIVLLLVLLFGLVMNTEALQAQLLSQSTSLLGKEGGALIEGMLQRARAPARGWSALFGVLAAAVGATTAFAELKGSLDDLLAKQAPTMTLWQTVRARLMSFGIIVTLGFLLLVSLLANAVLAATSDALTRYFALEAVWIGRALGAAIAFLGTFALFYAIYRLLPERRLTQTALMIGAVASTVLFSFGRIAIGAYLGHTEAISAFGAAGSLAVVLIWVYYSSLAFFAGALAARYVEERGVSP